MLHEPVTLDGYGALMIPAKVAELGLAAHWQFLLKTFCMIQLPGAQIHESTHLHNASGLPLCSQTATQQEQNKPLLSLNDLASVPWHAACKEALPFWAAPLGFVTHQAPAHGSVGVLHSGTASTIPLSYAGMQCSMGLTAASAMQPPAMRSH